ncbi:LOW QUALITY PROTEIN: putative DEAD-box ATP-dependent RNA helicase 48 [Primulina tabacum]|uniref:LOW QUALITY PROTEIN: putative DEAD-box ATP-dependent RNA helicase 48 n=1 Tax=Primulina tabacum TaxID=48773 RepID=UPI003F5A387B
MNFCSVSLHQRFKSFPRSLTFLRSMGGGPRTFPGGLNKWQWKRLHEKKAREKEKRLLDQEKQVYQARVRSEIRAKLTPAENPSVGPQQIDRSQHSYGPLSAKDHIRALADRFMKEGAEDLWNEADGPLEIPVRANKAGGLIDSRKSTFSFSVAEKSGDSVYSSTMTGNLTKPRYFCTYRKRRSDLIADFGKECSSQMCGGFGSVTVSRSGMMKDVSDFLNFRRYYSVGSANGIRERLNFSRTADSIGKGSSDNKAASGGKRAEKWSKFRGGVMDSSDDDSDDYEDEGEPRIGGQTERIVGTRAALGKYDIKIKKRLPLNIVEDEDDLSQQVEVIRKEFRSRSTQGDGREEIEEESILSSKRFDECNISPLTVRALTEAGYVQMTAVQDATLSVVLEGKDALVKARAGTGKSIAFLLPAIETVLKASSVNKIQRVPPIYILVLCPTREIASQICAEANVLLKHHDGVGVQTLVGGTRFKVDQKRLESNLCQIIVATPGRLLDHIENKSSFSVRLMGLQMLILDEADCLLDLGFRKDVENIVDCLPRKRQTLLFSATMPKEVRRISQLVLKRESSYIDTVGIGSLEIHEKVKQFYLVAPHDQHFHLVHHLLKHHTSQVLDYKVIVFCATAAVTSFLFSLFRELKLNVREIHSKKPSLYRTRISDEFKASKGLILITSDVSARGMHYPDVTLVIQVGIPPDRGQYIHRLGRTGRQGKEGEGFLLLAPWEQYFLDELKDLPIEKVDSPTLDPDMKVKIENSSEKIDASVKEAAYHAWLGYYNSINVIGRDKTTLVELANQFSASIGLQKPPALFRKTALKMGLKGISGIRIRK